MVFSSAVFLYLFLPLFLLLYYATPFRFKSYVILLGSYAFYAWWRVDFLVLIAGISLWSYVAARFVARSQGRTALVMLWLGIGGDLLALAYFKYFNFIAENVNAVGSALGLGHFDVMHVILPIGISFHVFQSVSYVIDVYRKDAEPSRRLVDFLAFTSLFPQLIAGPVLRYKDLAQQFVARTHTWAKFNAGTALLAIGLCKKVLIADSVAPLSDTIFAQPAPTLVEAWLGAAAYTIQLYFDFSGYSDMAVGLGLMMGFVFIKNFDDPYISRSITEFWRRWHISLSTWLRDYLYIPLGGNRRGNRRTYFNLMATMTLGGLWHGANWTFLLWGIWHGGWMTVERARGIKRSGQVYPALVGLPLTFIVVVLGWVMFRAPNVGTALGMYGGMIGLNGVGVSDTVAWQLSRFQLSALALGYFLVWGPSLLRQAEATRPLAWVPNRLLWFCLPVLVILASLKLSQQTFTPFLYFQF